MPTKEYLKKFYENQINFLNSNIADMEMRLGFDTREPDTGEPDREFLEEMIKSYEKHIEEYKKLIQKLNEEKYETTDL